MLETSYPAREPESSLPGSRHRIRYSLGLYFSKNPSKKSAPMNRLSLVVVLTLAPTTLLRAQNPSPQAPPPPHAGHPENMPDPMHAHMMEMHQHEMEAMKADLEKMKLSLATIKANIPQISDSAEKAR